jgi:NTP pyrophosphatase (non-canonical NTP hydrolase)
MSSRKQSRSSSRPTAARLVTDVFEVEGETYQGLERAQEFFEAHVPFDGDKNAAFTWLSEEVGELARIIRTGQENRYRDGIGDVMMWLVTLSKLLDVRLSDSLRYSVGQLVAKGFTDLKPTGRIDPPLGS